MLRILRQGQRWVLWFVILVVGGVFVFYLGVGGAGGRPQSEETVVAVGERRFTLRDVDRERRRQEENYRQALGSNYNPDLVAPYLAEASARSLMRTALLAEEAERLGLRATDPEVRDYLRSIPGASDERGRIDRVVVTDYAQREYGTLRRFQESLRDGLLAQKIQRLLHASVNVSEAEAREALRLEREEVDLAYVAMDPTEPPANLVIDPDSIAEVVNDEAERVAEAYQAQLAEFDKPERVRARHILFRLPQAASEDRRAEVRAKAEEALEKLREGADFAELAGELSEDTGTRARGGDLGLFPRGRMVKPFEDAAFELEPGELSDLVETVHGLHIIRTEEKRAAEKTPLEEVQEQLARELLEQEAAAAFAAERSDELLTAIREGTSLVDAARQAGLSIQRPDPLVRRPDGRIPGLGAAPELMAAVFAADPERPSLDRVFDVAGQRVLVQVLERRTPSDEELTPLVEARRQQLVEQRRNQLQQHWLDTRSAKLSEAGELYLNVSDLAAP